LMSWTSERSRPVGERIPLTIFEVIVGITALRINP
jgi:hypothetical protein